jgi:hypothetical protein
MKVVLFSVTVCYAVLAEEQGNVRVCISELFCTSWYTKGRGFKFLGQLS